MSLSDELRNIAQQILARKEAVFFAADGVAITFETHLKELTPDGLKIANAVSPALIAQVSKAPGFSLQMNTIRLRADTLNTDGKDIIFPVTHGKLQKDGRKQERFTFTKQEAATCEILNPYDLQTVLRKDLIDISTSGLSLRSLNASKLFEAQTALPRIRIMINGDHYAQHQGVVVYTRQLMNIKGETFFQTGIKFQ